MKEPSDEMCRALYEAQAKLAKEQYGIGFSPWATIAAKPGLAGIEGLRVALRAALALSDEAEERLGEALELLRAVEFTTVLYDKCPVCLGFEKDGNGETSRHHNAKCSLNAFLKRCTDKEESK